MVKRKKKTKKQQKQQEQLFYLFASFIFIFMGILGALKLGFLGILIANSLRIFVGNLYRVALLGFIAAGLVLIFYGRLPDLKTKRPMLGILWLVLGFLVLLHALLFQGISDRSSANILGVTWDLLKQEVRAGTITTNVGGGLLGALLYSGSLFLVDQVGSYSLSVLSIAVGIFFLSMKSGQDLLEAMQKLRQLMQVGLQKQQTYRQHRQEKKAEARHEQQALAEELAQERLAQQMVTPAYSLLDEQVMDEGFSLANREAQPSVVPIDSFHQQVQQGLAPMAENASDFTLALSEEQEDRDYQLPPVHLLEDTTVAKDQSAEYQIVENNIQILEQTFQSFGVDAKVVKASLGPSVTKYEIQPAVGVKVSKIVNLSDDLSLALAAKDIRIEAPIPGKSLIGIEVPNQTVSTVSFRDILESQPLHADRVLEVPLGRDVSGIVRVADLAQMPHLLIAGSTGSGKSVAINGIIVSLLMHAKPHEVKLMMIDPKMVELNVYNGIPHLLTPVVTNPKKAAQALQKVVQEMEQRYEKFAESGVRNLSGYNEMVIQMNLEDGGNRPLLPLIVVVVDELADLMMVASHEVEDAIIRLAQMARAAGIHMILATQRPSVDVITGIIKANVPSRIAFAVSSGTDSRTIIDMNGAEKLLGRGDMLFLPMGENKPIRIQGAFISDQEVERVVQFVKAQQDANYQENMMPTEEAAAETTASVQDELFEAAKQLVIEMQTASISLLQRRFRIGYNRAARLIDELEAQQVIGPSEGSKPRKVLLDEPALPPDESEHF